ncbi:hypothetical protein [Pseudoalteromonas rubra]|uniref:hypothetical protein n=1 Tax=Pseudoalteromonas rubra TaxID=43658 RepID=UPI002DB9FE3C|nr:hypothetical protein [Pseudoalteromonas rubra]MEC4088157.1 hypothetical protein [Pseudoalteromonas rubra]
MKYLFCLLLMGVLSQIDAAIAHNIDSNKARLTLRDGQAELRLHIDMQHWFQALQDPAAWMLGDTDAVMATNLTPPQQQAFIKSLIENNTVLHLNNTIVALQLKSLHTLAHHTGQTELVLEGLHRSKGLEIEQVSLTLPPSLGTVHLNVTRPQYRMLAAGKTALITFN